MQLVFPQLPYSYDAIEASISRATLELHYDKLHRAYVEKSKSLAEKATWRTKRLSSLLRGLAGWVANAPFSTT